MKYRRTDIYEMLDTLTLQDKKDLKDYLDTQIKEQELQPEQSYLEEQWDEIHRLIRSLDYEPYIDDQYELSMIYDLFQALSFTTEEKLWCADTIFTTGPSFIHADGARIYKENGKQEKYYAYLELKLAKDSGPYKELIDYYQDSDADKAKAIAEMAMKKCTNDLTDIVIFLLTDALNSHNDVAYNKLMKSAKLRRTINYDRVLKAMDAPQVSD